MKVLKFRITVKEQDDFIREIEIKLNQTFRDLHDIIVKSVKLYDNELASFHITNEKWERQFEITLIDMSGEIDEDVIEGDVIKTIFLMNETKLNKFIKNKYQRLVYEYDFLQLRDFFIEVIDIFPEKKNTEYPRISYSSGVFEQQENLRIEKDSDKLREELLDEFDSMLHGNYENDDDI